MLTAGKDVAIFPEGTSTDGSQILNFHSALFQAAVDTGRAVHPVALSYYDADAVSYTHLDVYKRQVLT